MCHPPVGWIISEHASDRKHVRVEHSHMPHLGCENLATTESSRDEIKVVRNLIKQE